MNRDLDVCVLLVNGEPMTNGNNGKNLTVGAAVLDALVAAFQQEVPQPTAAQKDARFNLGVRVSGGGQQEFTIDELNSIKECCNLMYGTLIYGQISAWADGRPVYFSAQTVN